jgi:hypothetical protein
VRAYTDSFVTAAASSASSYGLHWPAASSKLAARQHHICLEPAVLTAAGSSVFSHTVTALGVLLSLTVSSLMLHSIALLSSNIV